ncbi:MAG: arsenic resistance N-acetyltransferase ArsN2 [Bacillota bacterium]
MSDLDLKAKIVDHYGKHAQSVAQEPSANPRMSCCGGSSCGCGSAIGMVNYDARALEKVPNTAALASAGCGNPTMLASIRKGEVVLDLGSGGGLDVLISAQRVGPEGRVYGVDMTPEMLMLARANAAKAGAGNVQFLEGDIEQIPLPDNSVDVIISNCVINLTQDKQRVFSEAYRVLKPGGRLAVSDIMFDGDRAKVPQELLDDAIVWASCVGGALEIDEYKSHLAVAGFEDISVQITAHYGLNDLAGSCCGPSSVTTGGCCPTQNDVAIVSGFARATKPDPTSDIKPIEVGRASANDLGDILGILTQHSLPVDGVTDRLADFLVAKQSGRVIGVCGVERYGDVALLRSVAVTTSRLGRGLGHRLVDTMLAQLNNLGVKSVYLLTTTAPGFFQELDFERISRELAPEAIKATSEFHSLCPSSAVVMRKNLAD